jgi:hypothetical protein
MPWTELPPDATSQHTWVNTYPDGLVPMGPKGSNRAPGGTAPGGSRVGRPEDGSMSALGKPDLKGSTIMPPLRHLRREGRWVSDWDRQEWTKNDRMSTLDGEAGSRQEQECEKHEKGTPSPRWACSSTEFCRVR